MEFLSHWIEDQDGKVFSLQNPFSIGRSPNNTYVIDSTRVSRRHALVQARAEGEFWLTDLGSRNGVFLNRQPLQQSTRLKAGDFFQIADSQFVFHAEELLEIKTEHSSHIHATLGDHKSIESWIIIADIIGSVGQAQALGPNVWTGKVAAWIGQCRAVLEQNGAVMNKFLGDGFLSYWSREHSSPQQVATALEQMIALQKSVELPFRFVVHYGPVQFVGIARGEITLAGDAINLSFRLEKVASKLGRTTVASRPVIDACEGLLEWENLGAQTVPGFAEPIELYWPNDALADMTFPTVSG